MKVSFTVPGPPVGKQRARRDPRSGRWFTPAKTRAYERQVRRLAEHALHASGLRSSWPQDARYMVRLEIYFGDRRHRDADNVLKAVQDALRGVLYSDDHRVGHETPPPFLDRERPRVEVAVEVVG